jgi:UDP-3-O-[3-hydroxymyristoyl] glucosamine N-acyltransferase
MIDPRFFANAGPFPLGAIAGHIGGRLAPSAPADFMVTDLANLEDAQCTELSLFGDGRYRAAFDRTRAGVILTQPDLVDNFPKGGAHLIFVDAPRFAFAEAAWMFYPDTPDALGLEDAGGDYTKGDGCRISKSANIGKGARIGARSLIGANAVIGPGVIIGDDCTIGPNTTIGYAIIGNRVQIYAGAVIGFQGFGFAPGPRGMLRVPQLGRVIIGDDVEIGANCAIDRGAVGDTVIGQGTVMDNLVQIGHNVKLGHYCVLSGQSGVAGSTEIGDKVIIGGGASISDHLKIGTGAKIAGKSGVAQDVAAGAVVAGYPAAPIRDWHRQRIGLERMFSRSRPTP